MRDGDHAEMRLHRVINVRDISDISPKFCARYSLFWRIGFNEIYCHLPDTVDGQRAIASNTLISEARDYMYANHHRIFGIALLYIYAKYNCGLISRTALDIAKIPRNT